jgi:tetratricopeptide (TPR) repeat protein
MTDTTDKIEKGSTPNAPPKKRVIRGKYLLLITILLMLTFMVFTFLKYLFWGKPRQMTLPNIQQVYNYDVMVPDEIGEAQAFAGPYVDDDIYQGQKAYEAEQYNLAFKHFSKALSKNAGRFDLKLYAALTQLKLGNDDLAQQYFYQIIEHPDQSLYTPQALWYSALVDLKNNNLTNCRESLDDLIKMNISTKKELGRAVMLKELLEGF